MRNIIWADPSINRSRLIAGGQDATNLFNQFAVNSHAICHIRRMCRPCRLGRLCRRRPLPTPESVFAAKEITDQYSKQATRLSALVSAALVTSVLHRLVKEKSHLDYNISTGILRSTRNASERSIAVHTHPLLYRAVPPIKSRLTLFDKRALGC